MFNQRPAAIRAADLLSERPSTHHKQTENETPTTVTRHRGSEGVKHAYVNMCRCAVKTEPIEGYSDKAH